MIGLLEQLKQLNLNTSPVEEIRKSIREIPFHGFPVAEFFKRKIIERGVENSQSEPVFNTVKRISINPNPSGKYGRASTPFKSIFYGIVHPENTSDAKLKLPRVGCACEIIDFLRENKNGNAIVTFSQWSVLEQLNVVAIIDPFKNYPNIYMYEIQQFMRNNFEFSSIQLEAIQFFSNEFSKFVPSNMNHEYLISALFAEYLISERGYDGVLYPSVQSSLLGIDFLCIALSKEGAEKLMPIQVLQSEISKKEKEIDFKNISKGIIEKGSEVFQLKLVQY